MELPFSFEKTKIKKNMLGMANLKIMVKMQAARVPTLFFFFQCQTLVDKTFIVT